MGNLLRGGVWFSILAFRNSHNPEGRGHANSVDDSLDVYDLGWRHNLAGQAADAVAEGRRASPGFGYGDIGYERVRGVRLRHADGASRNHQCAQLAVRSGDGGVGGDFS